MKSNGTARKAPRIAAFEGPDQVLRGSKVELRWKLNGGAPDRITLNGAPVEGASRSVTVSDDPTRFVLVAANASGQSQRELWIGTHAEGECISAHVEIALQGLLANPRWLRQTQPADQFAHTEVALLEVDVRPEAEGQTVCFTIEHEDGDDWKSYETRTAVAQGGKASVSLALLHPGSAARGSRPAAGSAAARFRFHAALA